MKVIAVYDSDGCLLFLAKTYNDAVNNLFGNCYINVHDELVIDGEWTTLKDYYGEDCVDMMAMTWDINNFNEFWDHDFSMKEYEVVGA